MKYKITLEFEINEQSDISYYQGQIDKAMKGHDNTFGLQLKIKGTENESNWLNFINLTTDFRRLHLQVPTTTKKGKK